MLNHLNRLKKDKDFRRIFRLSKPVFSGKMAVRAAENGTKQTRFGFVISNKIDKPATRRNMLKRRLRAISRELISLLKAGYDVVVVLRENYTFPYDYHEIEQDFKNSLSKSGLFR